MNHLQLGIGSFGLGIDRTQTKSQTLAAMDIYVVMSNSSNERGAAIR
jgi:hypothetical protein